MNGRVVGAMIGLRLRRVFRTRSELIWLLLMPMVFSSVTGQLMGDWSGGGSSRPRFMVYDADGGPAVERLLADLRGSDRYLAVRADTVVTPAQARTVVESGRATAALVVPAGFSARVAAGDADSLVLWFDSERLSSQTVRTDLDRSMLKLNTEAAARSLVARRAGMEVPADSARAFDATAFDRHWADPRVTLADTTLGRIAQEPGLTLTRAVQHTGPAYTLFFVMMYLLMSAKDLVAERHQRTLARLMVTRASSLDLVLGFFLGLLVLGLVQAGILLTLNGAIFHIDYGDSPVTLALAVLLFTGVSAAGSVLLGSVARSKGQADGLGLAVTLVMAAVGGLWWPLEVVPTFMQAAGESLPTGAAITVFHDMIGRGWGLAQEAGLLVSLVSWFLVLMALAVWRLRRLTVAA